MSDEMVGVEMGRELMRGFVQGRKMQMEKKRLAMAEKEQTDINDFRMQQLAQSAAKMQQEQQQYESSREFQEQKLQIESKLKERQIELQGEIAKQNASILAQRHNDTLDQEQQKMINDVTTDVSLEIAKIQRTSPLDMTNEEKAKAVETLMEPFVARVRSLGLAGAKQDQLEKTIQEMILRNINVLTTKEIQGAAEKTDTKKGKSFYDKVGSFIMGTGQ